MTSPIVWSKPKWKDYKYGHRRVWSGNRGEYMVAYHEIFDGVRVGPTIHASVLKHRPDGTDYYDFVERDHRFRKISAALKACERHKIQCLSMTTPAPVDTKPKNSKRLRAVLANALNAGSPKDSNGNSAKSASPNLEALLSRKRPGGSSAAEATKYLSVADSSRLAGVLTYTNDSAEFGLKYLGFNPADYDLKGIEDNLVYYGISRCRTCRRWHPSNELGLHHYCMSCDIP